MVIEKGRISQGISCARVPKIEDLYALRDLSELGIADANQNSIQGFL